MHLTKGLMHDLKKTNMIQQTIDGSQITVKQQPTNHCNFHLVMTGHNTTKLIKPNYDQRHKYI